MQQLRSIVDQILVPHTFFMNATRAMEQCYRYAEGGALEPVCVALLGPSRSGKSRGLKSFCKMHPMERREGGLEVPVLMVVVPSTPTVNALVELLLAELGDPLWYKGTVPQKTQRLVKLLLACGVCVLVLDEFQHFYDKSTHRVQHDVTDWLKVLLIRTKMALVVAGLPTLRAVIDQNEQLAGRFMPPIFMPRFDWLKPSEREDWIAILEAFSVGLSTKFDLPDLHSEEMSLRLYLAAGGLVGYLSNTLRQAVWDAIDSGRRTISLADLHRAHETAVWKKDGLPDAASPLDPSRLVVPTVDLIAKCQAIGTRADEAPRPRRKGKPPAADSASQFPSARG